MDHLVELYGYWAVLIGTFLEGETILILGGYAAHRGWLTLTGVMAAAFVGSFSGDQLYYAIGRHHGQPFFARRPRWALRLARGLALLRRHPNLVIFGSRFLYGLRIVIPFAIGIAGIPPLRFLGLNFAGAAVWAVSFALGGYFLGAGFEAFFHDFVHYETEALFGLAVAGALFWGLRVLVQARRRGAALRAGSFVLRPVIEGDAPFLRDLHERSLEGPLGAAIALGWPEERRRALIDQQHAARETEYRRRFPSAEDQIILVGGVPAGRILVAQGADELRLVDIALVPTLRGHGIGARLIRNLQERARVRRLPLRLSVETSNARALRLYERLGFLPLSLQDGQHQGNDQDPGVIRTLEWRADSDRAGSDQGQDA